MPDASVEGGSEAVLALENVIKTFSIHAGVLHAVNGVSLKLNRGQVIGLVGESGSGKSTVGRIALGLTRPTHGRVLLSGQDIAGMPVAELRKLRARAQIVFQDPWGTLNPRWSIRRLIEEPLLLHLTMSRAERGDRCIELLRSVRLDPAVLSRYPHQLSGGQLQRVSIARAIATRPALLVLDEPTSSLDLSVRAGIVDLLNELRHTTGVAMLFITHDLGTLKMIADRVAVLYLGRIVEEGGLDGMFSDPQHPYTRALLSSYLPADPKAAIDRIILKGAVPSPLDLPTGCSFHTRCPDAIAECSAKQPVLEPAVHEQGRVACLRAPHPPRVAA